MQIKCEYCGSMIEETADKCPFCGAANNAVKRTADKQSPNYSSGIRTDTCRRMRQQDFLLASIIRNQKHLVFIRMATSSLYTKTRQTANVPSAIRARMKLMLSMNFI